MGSKTVIAKVKVAHEASQVISQYTLLLLIKDQEKYHRKLILGWDY